MWPAHCPSAQCREKDEGAGVFGELFLPWSFVDEKGVRVLVLCMMPCCCLECASVCHKRNECISVCLKRNISVCLKRKL